MIPVFCSNRLYLAPTGKISQLVPGFEKNNSKFTGIKKLLFIVKQFLKGLVFITGFIGITGPLYSQQNAISICFVPEYDAVPLETGKKYPYKNDSVAIDLLKFYISGIRFYKGTQLVDEMEKKHHLIDIENPASQSISHANDKNVTFDHIVFNVGVDSITNESGALGGDLDPVNGMYWEWRSGYINMKLEGRSPLCPARKNQFTFHIGGYQYPYNTLQQLSLAVADSKKIMVIFDVKHFFQQVNIGELYEVMSPNEKATAMAKKIAGAFTIAP